MAVSLGAAALCTRARWTLPPAKAGKQEEHGVTEFMLV